MYRTYGWLVAREEFEPAGFAATLGLKDVRLVLKPMTNYAFRSRSPAFCATAS